MFRRFSSDTHAWHESASIADKSVILCVPGFSRIGARATRRTGRLYKISPGIRLKSQPFRPFSIKATPANALIDLDLPTQEGDS
jgi:hypothetical protein